MKRILYFAFAFGVSIAWADETKKEEARSHFEIGLAHFDREDYAAALAEFLLSRELFPTRPATKNAAVCLRKEKRYDEALEMFESLLRDFQVSPSERVLAEREIEELQKSVGTIDLRGAPIGASVIIDGKPRAITARVSAGSHIVRVYKEGFAPFELRVDLAGRTTQAIDVRLFPLERSGKLRVTEAKGLALEVVVDNVVVGKTPWEGSLSIGEHTVLLRGEDIGTAPVRAPVKDQESVLLNLEAAPLEASLRVDPTPASATVAIDGVTIGHGVWEGALRVGDHTIDVAADGFLTLRRSIKLAKSQRDVLAVALERDPESPMWIRSRDRVVIEAAGGLAMALGSSQITRDLGLGAQVSARVGYELASGIGVFGDLGLLTFQTTARGRTLTISADAQNPGTVDDSVRATGVTLGAAIALHRGTAWTYSARLGVGGVLGAAFDERTGTFTNSLMQTYRVRSSPNGSTVVDGLGDAEAMFCLYAAPEIRVGRRIGKHVEIDIGASGTFLLTIVDPKWSTDRFVPTSPKAPQERGDGPGRFPSESMLGGARFVITPSLSLRADF